MKLPMRGSDPRASIASNIDNFNAQVNAFIRLRISVAYSSTANTVLE